ncbi:prolyl oligopeptidase family protein, partial [Nocardiopsis coralliicola]
MRSPSVTNDRFARSAVDTVHGRPVPDPYRWLEDGESTGTRRWLADRERAFAAARASWPLRARLAADIASLAAADQWSPPVLRGGVAAAAFRPAGAEHPRLVARAAPDPDATPPMGTAALNTRAQAPPPAEGAHRRPDPAGAGRGSWRVLYDPAEADASGSTTLDAWELSPDGRLAAVQTSAGGTERGALQVLCTSTGRPVEEPIGGLRYTAVAWLPSADAFYYVRRDGHGAGIRLHRVGGGDVPVRERATQRSVPGVRLLGGRWLLASESHGTGHRTDLWCADLSRPGAAEAPQWVPIQVGEEAETTADLGPDGLLYLRTTLGAPRRRICAVDPAAPVPPAQWPTAVAEDPGATLDGFTAAGAPEQPTLLLARTRLGISTLTEHDARTGRPLRTVPLPAEGMVSALASDGRGGAVFCFADVAAPQRVLALPAGSRAPRLWPEPAAAPAAG